MRTAPVVRGGTVRPGALLASPVLFGSIALLLLNDRVFKEAWPGLVTGKLSDVAGVAMVAILLTALLRRRGVAFGLTVVAFTVLKVVPVGAVWAAPVLGGVTRTDPTDLVALLVLVPLGMWTKAPVGDRHPRPRTRPPPSLRLPLQVMLIGAAIFATSATSEDCGPAGASSIGFDGDRVFVTVDDTVFVSDDFGSTWRDLKSPSWSGQFDDISFGTNQPSDTRSCTEAEPCIEFPRDDAGDTVVRRTGGATSVDVLVITSEQLRQIGDVAPTTNCGDPRIADGAIIDGDGEHVVLAVGTAGLLHRDPAGTWEWIGVGQYGFEPDEVAVEPLGVEIATFADSPPFPWGRWIARTIPVVVIVATLLMAVPLGRLASRTGRSRRAAQWSVVALAGLFVAISLLLYQAFVSDDGFAALVLVGLGGMFALMSVIGLVSIAGIFGRQMPPQALPPPDPGGRRG